MIVDGWTRHYTRVELLGPNRTCAERPSSSDGNAMPDPMLDVERPAPLNYHRNVVNHLKAAEPGAWAWFASSRQRAEEADAVRLELLKSTYHLDPAGHPGLFDLADELRRFMNIHGTVAIYQTQIGEGFNASLAFLPGEAHVVLAGPVLTALSSVELKSLLAHELAHYLLYEGWDGDYLTASDLIRGLANDASAGREYAETARLWSLYTELFCDRWALRATGDLGAVVRTLVKAQTGLGDVNADSYLRQAADIFRAGPVKAGQLTHPELYIRARALELWAKQDENAEAEIERFIQGALNIDRLDVLSQRRASQLTRAIVVTILAPTWAQTDANLAHARQFFPDLDPSEGRCAAIDIAQVIADGDTSLRNYCCFLLMDFTTVDRELGEAAVASSLMHARAWGIDARFTELAQKELGLTKKAWTRLEKEAEGIVSEAMKSVAAETKEGVK